MLPAILFAMYEKDGMHLEDVLMHMIRVKFLSPVRKYETENYYETDPIQISCLLVRLNATLFFTFVKSFGTLTYAMIFTPSCNLVRVEYRLT